MSDRRRIISRPGTPSVRRSRSTAIILAAAVIAGATLSTPALAEASPVAFSAAGEAAASGVTPLTAASFAEPPQNDQPWVRWNFPPATATTAQLQSELRDMARVGIAGVEIGQGGVPTNDQLVAILTLANELGITVSLKAGDGDPGDDYPATDDYTRKTLSSHQTIVSAGGTFSGVVPGNGTIVAVLAYRCDAADCASTGGTVQLDRKSVRNLTGELSGLNNDGFLDGSTTGRLEWTAPSGAESWIVLTVRAVAYASMPENMSREGTQQLIDGYEDYWSPEVKALLRKNGGDIFVDSHATDPWGLPQELWSSNLATEFEERIGYDIVPALAALFHPTNSNARGAALDTDALYNFTDGSGDRIRSDHSRVRTDLFIDERIEPFQEWLSTYDLSLRLQPEDAPPTASVDQIKVAQYLDRPEHESLAAGDQVDVFRPIASANHMLGKTWYSTECCAARFMSYAQTYQDTVIRMNKEYAGGVTKLVYHVYSHSEGATSTWPGFHNFGKAGFSNAWNASQPFWVDAPAINAYFSRNQQVLTQGAAKVDVAVYMDNFSYPQPWGELSANGWGIDNHRFWQDLGLQRAGYTWDYLNNSLLQLPNAKVTNGVLAADGPAYRALIFDATQGPRTNTARGDLTIEGAQKMLEYARAGLPVVFVGPLPTQVPGDAPEDDATLAALVQQILSQRTVQHVADQAAVPAALDSVGVSPAFDPASESGLLSVRRSDAASRTDYYYVYNQGIDQVAPVSARSAYDGTPENIFEEPEACRAAIGSPCTKTGDAVATTVTLAGTGQPYTLDAWSGEITPIRNFARVSGGVVVDIALEADDTTIIALTKDVDRFGKIKPQTPVARGLVKGSQLPAPIDLTSSKWSLAAEDWQPGAPYGTTGPAGSVTRKVPVAVELDGLAAWPDIAALTHASGIGTYTTTFDLPADWTSSFDAVLNLGRVTDTVAVKVNGTSVPVNQIDPEVDITRYVKAGENTLAVRVATTLNNRLATLDTAATGSVKARGLVQEYGLIGPVTVSATKPLTPTKPAR